MADFAVIVPTVVGVLTLWAVVKEAWKRTLGRRGDLYRRLARLGPGAQLSFFEAIIGEPPAMKFPVEGVTFDEDEGDIVERHATFTQSLFVDPYLFLQTISDQGGTVEAFSVTTRRRWFRPTFTGLPRPPSRSRRAWLWLRYFGKPGYLFRIKLGRTTFSDIEEEPRFVRAWVTPRTAAYSEAHGGGTPTLHQTFVLTTSTAAGSLRLDRSWTLPTESDMATGQRGAIRRPRSSRTSRRSTSSDARQSSPPTPCPSSRRICGPTRGSDHMATRSGRSRRPDGIMARPARRPTGAPFSGNSNAI